jgi:putative DNA primase/helicase
LELEQGKALAEALVKQLTGGEKIRARRMREDFWEFPPTHKLWLAANHKPVVRGTDHAIWRRIKLIPFTVTFVDKPKDRNCSGGQHR